MGTIQYRVPTVEEVEEFIREIDMKHGEHVGEQFTYSGIAKALMERYIIQEKVKDRKPIQTVQTDKPDVQNGDNKVE